MATEYDTYTEYTIADIDGNKIFTDYGSYPNMVVVNLYLSDLSDVNNIQNLFIYTDYCVFGDSTQTNKVIEDIVIEANLYGGDTIIVNHTLGMGNGCAVKVYGSTVLNVISGSYYISTTDYEYFIGASWSKSATSVYYGNTSVVIGVLNDDDSNLIIGGVYNDATYYQGDILGGGAGTIYGSTSVIVNSGTITTSQTITGGSCWGGKIYGNSSVTINGGIITVGKIVGGSLSSAPIDGNSWVEITGGTVTADIIAGGAATAAYTKGDAWITISGGTIYGSFATGITDDIYDDSSSTTSLNFNVEEAYTVYASITTTVSSYINYWFDEINFNGGTVTFSSYDVEETVTTTNSDGEEIVTTTTITITPTADFTQSQLNFTFDVNDLDSESLSYSFIIGETGAFTYEKTYSYSISYDSDGNVTTTEADIVSTEYVSDYYESATTYTVNDTQVYNLRIYDLDGETYIIDATDSAITTYQVTVNETTLYVNSTDYSDYVSGEWINGDYVSEGRYYGYNAFASFDEIQALFATADSANNVTEEIILANDFTLTADEEDTAKYFYTNTDVELSGAGSLTIQPSSFYFTSSLTDSELATMTISVNVDASSSTLYVSNLDLAISNDITVSSASFDIDDDAQLSLTIGSTLEYSSSFDNDGTIYIDLTGASESVSIYKVIDYTGEGTSSADFGTITFNLSDSSYYTVEYNGDLYVTNADDSVAYVSPNYSTDADDNSYSFGDILTGNGDIGDIIYGINAFAEDVEYDYSFDKVIGGAIVEDEDTDGYYCDDDIVVNLDNVTITPTTGRVYGAGIYYAGSNEIHADIYLNITGTTSAVGTVIYGVGLVDGDLTVLSISGNIYVEIDVEIDVDDNSEDPYTFKEVYGGGAITNDGVINISGYVNVTINSGTFTSFVGTGTKCLSGSVTVGTYLAPTGTNLTITGGDFQYVVYGGAYSQGGTSTVYGNCTTYISGGTFAYNVYGGSLSSTSSLSASCIIDGNVIMTIDSNDSEITFNADIYVGSYAYGTISGYRSITFTGLGENLNFDSDSSVYGESSSKSSSIEDNGGSYLIFDGFTGNFDAGIGYFDNIEIINESKVVITGGADDAVALSSISSWTFELDANYTALTLSDNGTGIYNDFTGDDIILEFSADDFDAVEDMLTVLDAETDSVLAGFDSFNSVTMIIDGETTLTATFSDGAWSCKGYSFSMDDESNLVVTKIA